MMTDDELSNLLKQLERATPTDADVVEHLFGEVDVVRRQSIARRRRYHGFAALLERMRWTPMLARPVPATLLILALLIAALSVGILVGTIARPRLPLPIQLDGPLLGRPPTIRIDASSEITITGRPGSIAVHEGSVWVADGGALTRIDPGKDVAASTLDISPGRVVVAAGPAGLWLAEVDTGRIHGPIDTNGTSNQTVIVERPEYLAVGSDGIWVSSPSTGILTRIDPSTGRIVAEIPLGNAPSGITLTDTEVLVGHDHAVVDAAAGPHDGAVSIIDRAEPMVIDDIAVSSGFGYVHGIVVVGDDIWYVDSNIGSLVQVDRATRGTAKVVAVGERIEAAVVVDGRIWMTVNPSGEPSALVGFDPATGRFVAALGPADIAPASTLGLGNLASFDGSLWVAADWPGRRSILRVEPPV